MFIFIARIQNNEKYNEKSRIFFRKASKVLNAQKYVERKLKLILPHNVTA